MENEVQYSAVEDKYLRKSEVTQDYYSDVDKIVGDEYCGEKTLGHSKESSYDGTLG